MEENKDLTEKTVVTHSDLRLGAKVVDGEQNTGVITSIQDKHNVEVQFDNGGAGLWCFVVDCDEYIKDSKEVLYYCENEMKYTILNTISDLCSDFLYYDRKLDEDLTSEQLNEAVKSGEITIDEMVEEFRKHLENSLK